METNGKAPVTIHDIAEAAGVSPSTVSRVLTGTTPVGEAKRLAVLAAVERLNYQPNVMARGLAGGHSKAVGVLTQTLNREFYSDILVGIDRGLKDSGFYPVFASGSTSDELSQAQLLVSRHRVEALAVVGGKMPETELLALAKRVPLVVVGRLVRGLEDRCLRLDQVEGARTATRHLIDLGHRRIAHITGRITHQDSLDRIEGYRQALSEAGIESDPALIVEGDFEESSGFRATETLFEKGVRFTAIFAAADLMAYGARLSLFRHELSVPEDVSLVGFDDQHLSSYAIPPLTTVRQPRLEMGHAAATALLAALKGQTPQLPALRVEFVPRASTAPCRG